VGCRGSPVTLGCGGAQSKAGVPTALASRTYSLPVILDETLRLEGARAAPIGALARNYARPRSEEERCFHAGADELLCVSDASHSGHAHAVVSVPEARVLYSPSQFSASGSLAPTIAIG
jgi:hypothetical protein